MTLPLNKIAYCLLLIFSIGAISACNYVKNVKLLTSGSLERADFNESIPFTYNKDLIIVEAEVNGHREKRQFIFDTGAFDSKIEHGLAEELNLHTKATKTNSTAQGISQKIEVTQLEKLVLGETSFTNISAGKLEYGTSSASRCIAPDGIIGANLMKLANWKIDYASQQIHFSDHAFNVSEEANTIHFDHPLLSGTPEIEVEVDGKTVSGVLFDMGFNGGLVLPSKFASSFTSEVEKKYYDQSTSGIFGTNTDTLISKELNVSLAGFDMKIPVEFSSIGKALLGNDILEHFTVTIDYENDQISLDPQSEVHVASPYSFIPGIMNDSLWVVNRTTASLPFSLGDTLLSINNKKPEDVFSSYCDYFLNVGTLINSDSLKITKEDGSELIIYPGK